MNVGYVLYSLLIIMCFVGMFVGYSELYGILISEKLNRISCIKCICVLVSMFFLWYVFCYIVLDVDWGNWHI